MKSPAPDAASSYRMKWAIVWLLFGFLWFTLINQLRVEWSVNPQYSYGWVVPFLCVGLLLRRWQPAREKLKAEMLKAEIGGPKSDVSDQISAFQVSESQLLNSRWSFVALFATTAFLYLPTRLIQEANPEWRMISWALAIEVVVLTLFFVRMGLGANRLRDVVFPICFFLVAVPWPFIVEKPLIQGLTRTNSGITVEVLGWMGIPAIQHGNLIEVGTGTVGVSEACSGIRSFQTSLMISLFFGEFYRMGLWRRLLLVPAGFILAMAFNVCRMTFLTMVAAKKGIAAIDQYHDEAGLAITITCTLVLWAFSVLMNKNQRSEIRNQRSALNPQPSALSGQISAFQHFRFQRLGIILCLWVIAVEVGVESWYRWQEARLPKNAAWTMDLPRRNPTFWELPLDQKTKRLLRFDEGGTGAWRENDGTQWQMFYFHWLPGRSAAYLAKFHTPDICLPASGYTLQINPGLDDVRVHGLLLPFRTYSMNTTGGLTYVFYCRWEDRSPEQGSKTADFDYSYASRLDSVLEGRRSVGQRTLEILISGTGDLESAEAALERQLQTLIKVEK